MTDATAPILAPGPSLPLLDYLEIRKELAAGPCRSAPKRLRDAAAVIILASGAEPARAANYALDMQRSEGSFGSFENWEALILAPFLMGSPAVSGHIGTHLSAFRAQWTSFSLRSTSPWIELSIAALLSGGHRADDSYLLSRISAAWKDLKTGHFWQTGPALMPDLALLAAFKPDNLIDLDLAVEAIAETDLPRPSRMEAAILGTLAEDSLADHAKQIERHRAALIEERLEHAAEALPLLSLAAMREPDPDDFRADVSTGYDALRIAGGAPAMAQCIALGLAILVRSDPTQTRVAAIVLAKTLIEAWRRQQAALIPVYVAAP
ncbi:hypothetical protein [Parvularcula marina]|uniref:hypothetical protein n=1 Tax=Parvularcula marina TaxID=2292771 RepID=UPI0035149550